MIQGTTVTEETTAAETDIVYPEPQSPEKYPETYYGGILPEPGGAVITEMNKITPVTQRKNTIYLYTFLNTQGNKIIDLRREDTLFKSLLSAPGT